MSTVAIDDDLIQDAMDITGLKSKKETIELSLKTLVQLKKQEEIRRFRGKLNWNGDLDEMRTDA